MSACFALQTVPNPQKYYQFTIRLNPENLQSSRIKINSERFEENIINEKNIMINDGLQ